MLEELNRRLNAIGGYLDGVNERTQRNFPKEAPPFPNRYIRRKMVEEQIEDSLFSPNLNELHEFVPKHYCGPEFIKQLIESENVEDDPTNNVKTSEVFLDQREFTSIMAMRNTEKSAQFV